MIRLGRTKAGNNVTFQSALPQEMKSLPAINLFIENEQVEIDSISPRVYLRTAKLTVEIIASRKTEEELLDDLDTIGADVEEILAGFPESIHNADGVDPITGEKCYFVSDILPTDVNYDLDATGEKPIGSLRIGFDVEYFENLPELGSPVDTFLKAAIDWRQDGVHADDGPNDELDIPQ